jgi:hypothetical protein
MHVERTIRVAVQVVTFVVLIASYSSRAQSSHSAKSGREVAVLSGAGDFTDRSGLSGAEPAAKLLDQIPGTVMAVGDLASPDGSKANFECYGRTWGRAKTRTRPATGNHEFHAAGALRPTSISMAQRREIRRMATIATSSEHGTSLF